ncbi:MAG: glycosyl hydrolase family 17 protein [Ignavibacteriaceae bacterium]|jgi:exo-beta-1,3-glucanase (GH17 family)|nr:glycosyl hydrolase family 17 protein [Ignavibacteriaceae bacterium]
MSRSQSQYSAVAGIDLSKSSKSDLDLMFLQILKNGIHGISFSAYLENQSPGSIISEEQIEARMKIIKPYVKWVRSFSCVDGNEHIPRIAHKHGIKTLVGAWLGDDKDKNENEIESIIKLAKEGNADILAVGNEVLLRGDLTEDEIIGHIQKVKQEIPNVPVGYVDAYFEFVNHPRLCNLCDVILANCYPFWEGYPLEHSLAYLKNMYYKAVSAAKGKKVIISETGWPNLGTPDRNAVPSYENALVYFINTFSWANQENIDVFYFSSFDETWKIEKEGDVGAYWGLWDKDGNLKFGKI